MLQESANNFKSVRLKESWIWGGSMTIGLPTLTRLSGDGEPITTWATVFSPRRKRRGPGSARLENFQGREKMDTNLTTCIK